MATERRTVWILGAGFSRSLGGPLLNDLLSPATAATVQTVYASNPYIGPTTGEGPTAAARYVQEMFERHGGDWVRGSSRIWSDAEEFLGNIDAAASKPNSPAGQRLTGILSTMFYSGQTPHIQLSEVQTAARRLVAAACCAFLEGTDTTEERWQPYGAWAKQLKPNDTLITFNYDRVLEKLRDTQGGDIEVMVPYSQRNWQTSPQLAQVFKLHGSVDWKHTETRLQDGSVVYDEGGSDDFALICAPHEIGIATPGPTKRLAATELQRVWDQALERIRQAEVIVFVGYRFPPSDAEAREKLLKAIKENSQPVVRIHLVFGPELGHKDTVRMQGLLNYTMARAGRRPIADGTSGLMDREARLFTILTHPLWAEDFFTVWDRELLWPPGLAIRWPDGIR